MTEPFRPTPAEFEAIVRFRAESRIEQRMRRFEIGEPSQPDLAAHDADRLAELAEEIGEEEVARIVAEVETESRESLGSDRWQSLQRGNPKTQAEFADSQQTRIELHNVLGDVESGNWLHTHGMVSLGLPELEVRGVPAFLTDAAAKVLRAIGTYLRKPGVVVRLGESIQTGPNSVARFQKLSPIVGQEDHFEVERWAITPVVGICRQCAEAACTGHDSGS